MTRYETGGMSVQQPIQRLINGRVLLHSCPGGVWHAHAAVRAFVGDLVLIARGGMLARWQVMVFRVCVY